MSNEIVSDLILHANRCWNERFLTCFNDDKSKRVLRQPYKDLESTIDRAVRAGDVLAIQVMWELLSARRQRLNEGNRRSQEWLARLTFDALTSIKNASFRPTDFGKQPVLIMNKTGGKTTALRDFRDLVNSSFLRNGIKGRGDEAVANLLAEFANGYVSISNEKKGILIEDFLFSNSISQASIADELIPFCNLVGLTPFMTKDLQLGIFFTGEDEESLIRLSYNVLDRY